MESNESNDFSRLPLSEEVKRAIEEMGFKEATLIQSQSIPIIMSGKDVIGHSQTGTGKTAAFGIPAIEKIDVEHRGVTQVLILCPTRELAMQSCDEMHKFSKFKKGIRIVPVYGGQPIDQQIRLLKRGAEIVIGTPGRIMDHMRRKTLKLSDLTMVILDEADEMLNMGFREDIETILQDVPENRQTLLFSATMSADIMRITSEYQNSPVLVKVVSKELTVPNIKQYFYDVPRGRKVDVLSRLFDYYNPKRSMIFCNTKKMVDELASDLRNRGYMVEGLHGDMKQASRTLVMETFKAGRIEILIATDVAARGLDIDNIDVVFNFDLPQDMEYYIHRIGRTGRAGKNGMSFTLVTGYRQVNTIKDIERYTQSKIKLNRIPTLSEVEQAKSLKLVDDIKTIIENGLLDKHRKVVEQLINDGISPVDAACAALKMHFANEKDTAPNSNDEVIKNDRPERSFDKKGYGDRKDGKERSKSAKDSKSARRSNTPMTKLVINIGKKDNISANHILGAFAGETGLPGKAIGSIEIFDNHSFVEVPKDSTDLVLKAMENCRVRGKITTTEIVKGKKRDI